MRFCTDCKHSHQAKDVICEYARLQLQCCAHKHPVDGTDEFCKDVREWRRAHYSRCAAAMLHMCDPQERECAVQMMGHAFCMEFEERDATSVDAADEEPTEGDKWKYEYLCEQRLNWEAEGRRLRKVLENIGGEEGEERDLEIMLEVKTAADEATARALLLQSRLHNARHAARGALDETPMDADTTEAEAGTRG